MKEKIARYISIITHPVFPPIPLGLGILLLMGYDFIAGLILVLEGFLIVVGPILAYLYFKEDYSLRVVNSRERREPLYVLGFSTVSIYLTYIYFVKQNSEIFSSILIALFVTLAVGFANYITKISIHTSTITGFAAFYLFQNIYYGIALYILAFIVAWSRVVLKRHTPKQTMLGIGLTTVVIFISHWLLYSVV